MASMEAVMSACGGQRPSSMSSISQGRTPYTVRHRNAYGEKLESCFYANDAFEARLLAMEFNAYIRQHPNSIDSILQSLH